MNDTEVWIGRFDVRPRLGNDALGNAKGAIVNVVALATDMEAFIRRVTSSMDDYDFDITRHDDVYQLCEWTKRNTLAQDLAQAALGLTNESPIQFDEFQAYLHDDA